MNDFTLLLPEFLVTGLAFLILTADFFLRSDRKHLLAYLAVLGLAGVLAFSLAYLWNEDDSLYGGVIRVDGYALFFKGFFLVLGGVVILSSVDYVRRHLTHQGEVLRNSAVHRSGHDDAGLLGRAADGLHIPGASELRPLRPGLLRPLQPQVQRGRHQVHTAGGLLLGAAAVRHKPGLRLLGTTRFDEISQALASTATLSPGLLLGLVMIIAGLGFKVAAVPFHMWAPDAYEGAPIPITAYLAVGSKAAAFSLVLRFFAEALIPAVADWQLILVIMAALTLVVGNLMALVQRNIKRLLAYSSIGHVGYLLLGIAALAAVDADDTVSLELTHLASNGVMLHLVAYGITNMAAFLAVGAIYNITRQDEIRDLAGVARRAPTVAMVLAAALFSLAGLPIFAGFTSKFYLFNAAAPRGCCGWRAWPSLPASCPCTTT